MRKLSGLSIAFSVLLVLLVGGCANRPARPTVAAITGDWLTSETLPDQRRADTRVHIQPDGTFSGDMQVGAETVWTFAGRWQLLANIIHWEYTDSSLVLLVDDLSEDDTILQLGEQEMQLRSSRHDEVRTLRRIR